MGTACRRTDGTDEHHFLRRLHDVPGFRRVYLAAQRLTGRPVLVWTRHRDEEMLPPGIEVLVSTGDEPRHLSVEVRSGAPADVQLALEDGANLLRSALPLQDVDTHLRRPWQPRAAVSVRVDVRAGSTWRLWAGPVALAAGALLALWPRSLGDVRQADSGHVADVVATDECTALADALLASDKQPMTVRRRLVMPDGPLTGQDRPPCGKGYVAIQGGCWAELKQKAPDCPERSVEHNGGCYLPVKGATPVPMSIDRRQP